MSDHLKPIVEALIFASPEPLPLKTLCKLLEGEPKEDVEGALALLRQDYDRPGGLQLVEVAGGYQIVTKPELHEYVRRLFHERTTQKLSVKALETLAVIAYKQPVTAAEIADIRGVNTSGVLNTLIERKLVKIVGRKQVVGRPFMYATTREFLDKFGLNDISDLPKVEDLADVLGFDPPALGDSGPVEMPMTFDFDEDRVLRGDGESTPTASEGTAVDEVAGDAATAGDVVSGGDADLSVDASTAEETLVDDGGDPAATLDAADVDDVADVEDGGVVEAADVDGDDLEDESDEEDDEDDEDEDVDEVDDEGEDDVDDDADAADDEDEVGAASDEIAVPAGRADDDDDEPTR